MEFQLALDVVYKGLESVNALRSPEAAVSLTPDVILAGEGGNLDSLELVTLVLAIERRVRELTGQEVSLLDGDDFEHQLPAFRNPSLLADLIVEKSTD
jgi:hypothetical protein